MLPYMVPGTILGLGLILLWNKPGLGVYGTPLIIMIGYFARFSPLATKAVESNISQISFTLEEAALVSGASWGKSLWRIIIPLVKPGLLVAWMLVFVLCMGELSTTIMVYPPGYSTLPLSIFTLQHDGPPSLVAALSITLVALTLLSALLFYAIVKRVYNTGFINEVL